MFVFGHYRREAAHPYLPILAFSSPASTWIARETWSATSTETAASSHTYVEPTPRRTPEYYDDAILPLIDPADAEDWVDVDDEVQVKSAMAGATRSTGLASCNGLPSSLDRSLSMVQPLTPSDYTGRHKSRHPLRSLGLAFFSAGQGLAIRAGKKPEFPL